MNGNRPVLLLEDSEVDAMNVERAFRELKILNSLERCENGEEGLEYLSDKDRENPCIILLDLNMPRMNGIEFLSEIKKNGPYKRIPVVVLTTSKEEQDRVRSYDLGIAGYMVKPVDYKKFLDIVRSISLYWSLSEFA